MAQPEPPHLPIEAVLPQLAETLLSVNKAVLIAPPGAGKTTMVAPKLITQPWASGKIILLSPRRVAARAAAERMAALASEKVGETYGYAVRMDRKIGPNTKVEVLTEGLYLQMLQNDPELTGVSAILFDEVHERSLNCDFALALTLEAQSVFRPDLKIMAMSATLDGERFADLLDDAPVIQSEGRIYPLQERYLGRRPNERLSSAMAKAVGQALEDEVTGDILCFLPGTADIRHLGNQLEHLADNNCQILPLYGTQSLSDQRRALQPAAPGIRKIILATNIAETSLTIDGVRIVIDGGMARKARYDNKIGDMVLVTQRISQASATQRAGRAARQGPGVVYRLWEKAATQGFPPYDTPEILQSDLTDLVLQCAIWGESDPRTLRWLDAPEPAALSAARRQLIAFGALDDYHIITAYGRDVAQMPLPPALAHMVLTGARHGQEELAAKLALLLQERNLGGNDIDLMLRLERFHNSKAGRDIQASKMAQGWAEEARKLVRGSGETQANSAIPLGLLLASAFPEKLARRRDGKGQDWLSAGGRAYRLYEPAQFSGAEWVAIANVYGEAGAAHIGAAIAVNSADIETYCANRITTLREAQYDGKSDRVLVEEKRVLGAIVIKRGNVAAESEEIAGWLISAIRQHGLDVLPWGDAVMALRQRARFCGLDCLDDAPLLDDIDEWLLPLLSDVRGFGDIGHDALMGAMQTRLGWDALSMVERKAPTMFTSPAGSQHSIDYSAEAGPSVTLRVQALYGLSAHPNVGQPPIPLVLALTSPAGRVIQTTRDLPAFWAGSWQDVAKDMRGRYPKHVWPDDPANAKASLKTKNAQRRDG